MAWKRLLVTEQDGIVTVALNRPDKLNAIDFQMFSELDRVSRQLRRRRDIRCVILTGSGSDFSSGLDIKGMIKKPINILHLLKKWLPGNANLAQRVSRNWRLLPVPVIAVINGRCYGGGTQIALGADIRIAAMDAELSIMEVKWGLLPDMAGLLTLREVMGRDQAMRLTMTADILPAEQASELGLVTQVAEQPMETALALAEQVKQRSPDAVAAVKSSINRSWVSSGRALLSRETLHQVRLLMGKNFRIAVARNKEAPDARYRERSHW